MGLKADKDLGKVDTLNTKLKQTLLIVLPIDNIEYNDSIETVDIWDSMMHMEIIVVLEKTYSIRIEPEETIELTSVKAIQDFLETRGVI